MVRHSSSADPVLTLDFDLLFRRHGRDLLRFLRRRLSTAQAAEDVAQEAFVRLMRQPATTELRDPRAVLFTTAANLARDYGRHERVARTLDDPEPALAVIADPAPSAETAIGDQQDLARALAVLATLPDRTRIAFEMHRLGGFSQTEIARELGVSTTLVWRMIHEAYARLRLALQTGDAPLPPEQKK